MTISSHFDLDERRVRISHLVNCFQNSLVQTYGHDTDDTQIPKQGSSNVFSSSVTPWTITLSSSAVVIVRCLRVGVSFLSHVPIR